MRVLDLFSGIGGFSLGLEATGGFETVAFCEIESYPQKVLNKHWPEVPIYDDVRELTAERLVRDGIEVDVITGGFPCQDISTAGNQAGIGEGTRSGLWSECARLLGDIRPRYAIFENVTALLSGDSGRWFEQVLWDISQVGYDAEWHCIPASELGAHHHRDRVWIIAYPASSIKPISIDGGELERGGETSPERAECPGSGSGIQDVVDTMCWRQEMGGNHVRMGRLTELDKESSRAFWNAEPSVGRVAPRLPDGLYRFKCLGNAVVPQIPELIGRAILEAEHGH